MSLLLAACATPAEKAAAGLARRLVPQYRICFRETPSDSTESYMLRSEGGKVIIEGSSVSAMAVGLNRYLNDYCHATVSWYAADEVEVPAVQPLVPEPVQGKALVAHRFFLNYCTFGYSLPWWQWEDWERLIDWMALQGVNLPLAITGEDALWQETWRKFGLTDEEIRAWFTGPAHLPWHRMCNIDGVDGPLPQSWIDGQAALQEKILSRERELGMRAVLPAFAGHVPEQIHRLYPEAQITRVGRWGGFPDQNRCWFLSPQDSLYQRIQTAFLEAQTRRYGTDHFYGFDLFNEVDAPSWDPQTLSAIARGAYGSVAAVDPDAEWLQMGWMFHFDRQHWTRENMEAYLRAVPEGRVILLDYYTEHTPVWTLTDRFFGQPYIFCYLGNFGGNTRLSGPFRLESRRLTEALEEGGAAGIGCTLEGLGVNQWFYEYVLGRAWDSGSGDDAFLASLDRRHGCPEGFWREMADSIYLRGSFSEGPLLCGRPCDEGYQHWTVIHTTPYDPATLERLLEWLKAHPSTSSTWKADVITLECQVKGNQFAALRDQFVAACRAGELAAAREKGDQIKALLLEVDSLAAQRPEFSAERWLEQASAWGRTPEEKQYYRDNAWHLLTTWGGTPSLNDYANRLWSGLVRAYYLPRWALFIQRHLEAMENGQAFDPSAFNEECRALELRLAQRSVL